MRRSVVKEGRIFNNLKDEYIFDHPEDGWSLNLRIGWFYKNNIFIHQ